MFLAKRASKFKSRVLEDSGSDEDLVPTELFINDAFHCVGDESGLLKTNSLEPFF